MGHTERYERRLRLMAFAFNHTSEVSASGRRASFALVNVHHQGARLRKTECINHLDLEIGSDVTLDLNIDLHGTDKLAGKIGWTSGDDVWVDFGSPLTVGVSDLQRKLDN